MDEPADIFEDALEDEVLPPTMDLETSIEDARIALNIFLNNRFEMAKSRMESWRNNSMYHAVGYGTVLFIKAIMTCEQKDIEEAIQATKEASHICDRFRRRSNCQNALFKFVKNSNKVTYTYEQLHAELCYAESLLQRALLTFIQDENFVSFVRGALKIRACYQSYKECQRILMDPTCWSCGQGNDKLKAHFESGVRMGIGTFNLMISILPSRILRLLEFVGFSGDKSFGLHQLEMGSGSAEDTLRGPLCSLILLSWHLIFTYIVANGDCNLATCEKIMEPLLRNYPKGSLVLYFAGRHAEVRAQIPEAINLFHESIKSQSEWRQYHHICYWELTFSYAFSRQWSKAAEYAYKLYKENRWSKATYAYMCGIFLLANEDSKAINHGLENVTISGLLKEVPNLKYRIAGKSIPMEKFCVMKANRYFKKDRLPLAHYELLYLWNGLNIIGQETQLIQPVLCDVENVLNQHELSKDLDEDDYCICLFLKAMCLKHLQSPFQTEQCLTEIISYEKRLCDNYYLIPNALFELSLLKMEESNIVDAKEYLIRARSYKGYAMESRLHFRLHALSERLDLHTPDP